jgi:hypothetical protein
MEFYGKAEESKIKMKSHKQHRFNAVVVPENINKEEA